MKIAGKFYASLQVINALHSNVMYIDESATPNRKKLANSQ